MLPPAMKGVQTCDDPPFPPSLAGDSGVLVLCFQTRLLDNGIPPTPAAASTFSPSQAMKIGRVLSAAEVGIVTQGQGAPDHQELYLAPAPGVCLRAQRGFPEWLLVV